MPFLDNFVGSRDKGNRKKLTGALQEVVKELLGGRDSRTIPVTSTNGKHSLITLVPQCQSIDGIVTSNRRSGWMDDLCGHCIADGSASDGAEAISTLMAKRYDQEFKEAAKEVMGQEPLNSMDTIDCEAMMQHANLTFSLFLAVRKHITHSAGKGFKIMYSPKEKKKLESGPQSFGPEPMFGEYKYDKGDDGAQLETDGYWSTNLSEEVQSAVESDLVNQNAAQADKDSKMPAQMEYPETVDLVVGMDHGQGALRAFAKLLLTPPKTRKEKEDLSYGCPIVKFAHVQCQKDTY